MLRLGMFRFLILTLAVIACAGCVWGQTETVLYSFGSGLGGNQPMGSLVFDNAGNLYGTLSTDPLCGCGGVFELRQSNGLWREREHLLGEGAESPESSVTLGAGGHLYGTTVQGVPIDGGTVFELTATPTGVQQTELYYFCSVGNCADGSSPWANVILDNAGNLYGTTQYGGILPCIYDSGGCGTVFELKQSNSGWIETVLHRFDPTSKKSDGAQPLGNLIFDLKGNLYGTTYRGGGACGCGIVFELSPTGAAWTETVLYSFQGGSDGAYPDAGLVFGNDGNLYGTTSGGGTSGNGTVFKLARNGSQWTETVLYSFAGGDDGTTPMGEVVFDPEGNLYSTTYYGGSFQNCYNGTTPIGCGTVFKLSPSGNVWAEMLLYAFTGFGDGAEPHAGVILDSKGNLYGTTTAGGEYRVGTVFEVVP